MTVREFIVDRLRRMILWAALIFAAAVFLLATGTQSGIVTLLLLVCLLIFVLWQLIDFLRVKRRFDFLLM